MPTPHTVVITTAKTGPDRTVAGVTFTNVTAVELDLVGKRLFVTVDNVMTANPPTACAAGDNIKEFDLSITTAVTVAIVAGVYTVTIA